MALARAWTDKHKAEENVSKDAAERYLALEAEAAARFNGGWVMTGVRISPEGKLP